MKILLGKDALDWKTSVKQLRQASLPSAQDYLSFTIEFFNRLSQEIFKDAESNKYPDLISLAFWLRKANLLSLVKQFLSPSSSNTFFKPRGLVLHFAPSNVDTMFVYSWAISLLAGNKNILRLSTRRGYVAESLIKFCNNIFLDYPEYSSLLNGNMLLEYEHDDEITAFLSQHCEARIIWGGDNSIQNIRRIPIPAYAVEAVFANRFSLCLIKAEALIEASQVKNDFERLIEGFVNDAFWFDQQGCSSPRAVMWLGNESIILQAQNLFWPNVVKLAEKKFPELLAALSYPMQRISFLAKVAAENKGKLIGEFSGFPLRIKVKKIDADLRLQHPGLGCFYEMAVDAMEHAAQVLQPKDQTLTTFGFDHSELASLINQASGIDRIVPFGKALAFSPVWDGYNLFHTVTRFVTVEN
jgi:hypothetical protein